MSPPPEGPAQDAPRPASRFLPPLTLGEWVIFALLSGLLAAANIYTTLLIGWGDTGSIVAVLLSVVLLGLVSRHKPAVHTLNLGQTMVSAGGSIGFAAASYAAVRIVQPDFEPDTIELMGLFAAMGILGAIIGSSVRRFMVRYFFPSGTACAVIQTTVTREVAPGERNRPVFLLKLWGGIATLLTLPVKIAPKSDGAAIWHDPTLWSSGDRSVGLGADPLYYGIGIVVGPRVGLGMLLGALSLPFVMQPSLIGGAHEAEFGDWVKWLAIAVLTLPTFATILFAYFYKTPPVIPPGFTPGATRYTPPANRALAFGLLGAAMACLVAALGDRIFGLPWPVSILTVAIAWPLCVVNGRVTGDTDINPVRLVAIVLLSGFFWLISSGAVTLLGMAVIGGTLAAVAVDMMQDYRTGYLVDADPVHQTSVQFLGAIVGAVVAVPVLGMLIGQLGIGEGSSLPAPGARIWAAMAVAMAGGFDPSDALLTAIVVVSVVGCLYAWLTVWPATAGFMPSLFGVGIGMLVGTEASAAIFMGGMLKLLTTWAYTRGKQGDVRRAARVEAGNDTMLAGSSVFAAGAVVSILVVLVVKLLDLVDLHPFYIATH
ncbi:MAG: OPT/YSL family transporter [Planctomycetota bacterium]|jgi:uncharacterized oligopeptide transporter (OPT) family protein